ncbi:hypothetical protein HFN_1375 [Helicobacter fennelliae MRY12-0050]|uniref:Uncharacterized protein n=1 Tax=Helicobacter fennelliae MRY12-0050 TaxID=1325130 RepID=T1D4L6_9HELI|nr:hypothetical protein HFN_1375 [Helicobacter fennelliae MRY12-0050]
MGKHNQMLPKCSTKYVSPNVISKKQTDRFYLALLTLQSASNINARQK